MVSMKEKVENKFKSFGLWIFDNKYKTLALMLIFIASIFSQIGKITFDTSSEGFLHDDDPILAIYNDFRAQFGRDELIMLAIKTPDVFTDKFLKKLAKLHTEIEDNVPHLDEVDSLINARNTRGEGDNLIVEDLFENWPQNDAEMLDKKKIILESKLYKNFFISEDSEYATIIIRSSAYSTTEEVDVLSGFDDSSAPLTSTNESNSSEPAEFLSDHENTQIVDSVMEIVEKYQSEDFVILKAGSPIVVHAIKQSMQKDMGTSVFFALITIISVLLILFRRISGVLLPFIVVIITLISTACFMGATGTAVKLPTQILPSFILAVGVAASVHLLSIFYNTYDKSADKRAALGYAMQHSGLAITMTSITTAASLLSFSMSGVAPIADLGRFAAAGVLVSLMYSLILLPALMALIPIKPKQSEAAQKRTNSMDAIMLGFAKFSMKNSKAILLSTAGIFFVAIFGLLQLSFYHNPLKWLPESWESRQATELLDVKMKGTGVVEVVIDTGKENGLYDPAIINAIDQLHEKIDVLVVGDMVVGKTVSVVDILKETNRALHANDETFYTPPQDKALIAQELLLFENSGSDDLEDFVDSQFSKARFTIKTPFVDAASNSHFIAEVEKIFNDAIGDQAKVSVTGMGSLFGRTMDAAIESTKISYLLAAVIITIMMIAMLGSFKLGLVSMIPNLLPIVISLSVMGYLAMPLDMFTMLIGSIAIGLVVDDTIHFMHNFKRYYEKCGDVNQAVEQTLLSTGRAIFVTTVVLSSGFFIYMTAEMENVFNFGVITGTTIILALISDLLLAPALMKIIYEKESTTSQSSQRSAA